MVLHEQEIDELGLWVPRSGFFQHEYRKRRAKLMVQQEPVKWGARLAFCTYCQSAYLASDAVPNSACHDAPPALMYDLERLIDAATFVETFSEALQATDSEDLLHRVNVLAELVRDRVAGAADELSQEPSTASDKGTSESEQAGRLLAPGASVEDSTEAPASATPAPQSTPPPPPPPARKRSERSTPRTRQAQADAAAVAS